MLSPIFAKFLEAETRWLAMGDSIGARLVESSITAAASVPLLEVTESDDSQEYMFLLFISW